MNLLGSAQTVTFELEGAELPVLELERPDKAAFRIPVPEELLRDHECLRLVVRTGKVVSPRARDGEDRELGLKFYRLAIF